MGVQFIAHLTAGLAFVNVDNESGGFVVAVNADSGKVVWQQPRLTVMRVAYSSPLLVTDNSENAIWCWRGCNALWDSMPPAGRFDGVYLQYPCFCRDPVYRNGIMVAASGYRRHHMIAVKFDSGIHVKPESPLGSHQNKVMCPTCPHAALRYLRCSVVQDEGLAQAFELHTGKSLWKKRLGFPVTASLLG